MKATWFSTLSAAEAALNAAGIKRRDFPLFLEPCDCAKGGYDCKLELAAVHILNVNSPHNVNHRPGFHRSGDLKSEVAA